MKTRAWGFLVVAVVLLPGLVMADERLLGSWVGAGPSNLGSRVTVERGAVTIDGERLPMRILAPGLLEIGPRGDASQLRYELQGDVLITVDEDGRALWRRVKPVAPAPTPTPPPNRGRGSASPEPNGAGGATPLAGPVVMVQHTVRDPGVGNMESHTLLAPKGWTVTGGAWWARPEYFGVLPSRDIKVTAPDGRQVHLAPSVVARDRFPPPQLGQPRPREGTSDKGIPVIYMPTSLEEWKRWIRDNSLIKTYPGATEVRVTNAVVVPELTAALNKQIEWRRRMLAQQAQLDANMGMRTFIDAKVYAFECSYTYQGRDWQELILFGTTYEGFESQLIGRTITWDVNPAVVYRAPAGKLDGSMSLMVAIVNTLRPTPRWAQMCAEHQAKLAGIAAEGARQANQAAMERSRIIAQANSEISDIIMGGHKRREAIRDSTHRKVINSISGTNDYVVPGGASTVQLPSNYQRVYTNGNGEFLLTNDVLYDPNTDSALNGAQWTGMKARR